MDDLTQLVTKLLAQTQTVRCQFLAIELQTCRFALYFGALQVELEAWDMARREVYFVENACETILRFLPEIEDKEMRNQFATELEQVRESLHTLQEVEGSFWRSSIIHSPDTTAA